MNVTLPVFPGGEHAQFWWIVAIMLAITGGLLFIFNRKRWQ
jgi:LPXTG-motif cell wall-anchored protein